MPLSAAAYISLFNSYQQQPQQESDPSMPKRFQPMIGGDPEFFLANISGLMPSCGLFGGNKDSPIKIAPVKEGYIGAYLEDNVSLELNIPPADNSSDFLYNINRLVQYMEGLVKEKYKAKMVIKPSVEIPKVRLVHPNAFVFGCDPDFCAYDFDPASPSVSYIPRNYAPEAVLGNIRCAGGHIHLSYGGDVPAHAMIILMDALAGLPMLAYDKQGERRKHYGKAGLFRKKSYGEGVNGVEWRTPSNWWLGSDNLIAFRAKHVFDTILGIGRAAEAYPEELGNLFHRIPCDDLQECVAKEDVTQAKDMYKMLRKYCPYPLSDQLMGNSGYAFMEDNIVRQHADAYFGRYARGSISKKPKPNATWGVSNSPGQGLPWTTTTNVTPIIGHDGVIEGEQADPTPEDEA